MTHILVPYHLDEYLPDLDVPLVPDTTITMDLPDGDTWQRMAAIYEPAARAVAAAIRSGDRPVVLSGDCTASFATVAGLQRTGVDPGVVWFDAHGDVQTLETSTSGYLGGMPLRMLAGYRPELIATPLGMRTVAEEDVVLVDARDLDPPEAEYLATAPIRRCTVDELTDDVVPDRPVYLHVDFDVVRPADLPGLLFPTDGGPGFDEVVAAIGRVLATGRVAAIGLGCTWRPGYGAAEPVRAALDGFLSGAG